jgi:hypothetical protein
MALFNKEKMRACGPEMKQDNLFCLFARLFPFVFFFLLVGNEESGLVL